jgi:hypothetical protein
MRQRDDFYAQAFAQQQIVLQVSWLNYFSRNRALINTFKTFFLRRSQPSWRCMSPWCRPMDGHSCMTSHLSLLRWKTFMNMSQSSTTASWRWQLWQRRKEHRTTWSTCCGQWHCPSSSPSPHWCCRCFHARYARVDAHALRRRRRRPVEPYHR